MLFSQSAGFFLCQSQGVPGSPLQVILTPIPCMPQDFRCLKQALTTTSFSSSQSITSTPCASHPPTPATAGAAGAVPGEPHWDSRHCSVPSCSRLSVSLQRWHRVAAICISGVCRRCHQAHKLASCVSQRIHFRGVSLPPSQSGWLDLG